MKKDLYRDGQKLIALSTLQEVISNRRHRTWNERMEQIMKQFIQLCVELRKGQEAKLGLLQFRSLCQSNVESLFSVISFFLDAAEQRTAAAKEESESIAKELSELEAQTPENILLSSISGEDFKDRTDRTIVTPWLKFTWEAFRNVLDVLKNNTKFEARYQVPI